MLWIWFMIFFLGIYQTAFIDYFLQNPDFYQLDAYTWETENFRKMELGEYLTGRQEIDYDGLAALMITYNYDLRKLEEEEFKRWPAAKALIQKKKPVELKKLSRAYQTVLQDISCFPVPASSKDTTPFPKYQDDFLASRNYGGERQHEGCDLMGNQRPRGCYPVLSMTAGTVEKIGWLEKGGWRIGIRAPSGAYFYYAHLYQYSENWQEGDFVYPGTLLGYMGDSGYGIREGTVGNFDVHLHLGIYIRTDHYDELSVNPYWILKYSERFIRTAEY